MHKINFQIVVLCSFAWLTYTSCQEKYPTKYDFLNVDTILRNKRLLKSYYRCLMDEGPCTQEGQDLRKILPDALKTRCKKCTAVQKKNAAKVIEYVMRNRPEMWQGLLSKYDPHEELSKEVLAYLNVQT